MAVVFFHAHPDDEAIFTGGTMARLAAGGTRVVLVVATQGERGLAVALDGAGASLATHRQDETRRAADLLGVGRLEFLGYEDSGMLGDSANDAPGAFWSAGTLTRALSSARSRRERSGIQHHSRHRCPERSAAPCPAPRSPSAALKKSASWRAPWRTCATIWWS